MALRWRDRKGVWHSLRKEPEHQGRAIEWQVIYRDPNGRQRAKNAATKREAEREEREQRTSVERGAWKDPSRGRQTIGEQFEDFMRNGGTRGELRPSTQRLYRMLARRYVLPHLGSRRLATLRRSEVKAWTQALVDRGVRPSTVSAAHRLLRAVLALAESDELIDNNPARGVRVKRSERAERRFLSVRELEALANAVPSRYRALIILMGYCGLRTGEAVALRKVNVDLAKRTVAVLEAASEGDGRELEVGPTKTENSRRVVPLPPFVADALGAHLAEFPPGREGFVFSAPEGGILRPRNFRGRVWLPALRKAEIEAPLPTPHSLRHSAASLLHGAGASLREVQSILGHSAVQTTASIYVHPLGEVSETTARRLDRMRREAIAG